PWTRSPDSALLDRREHRLAPVLGLEHHQVADPAQDLAHEPIHRAVGDLDHDGAVLELLEHGALLAQPAGALRGDPDAGHAGAPDLPPREPLLLAQPLLDPIAGRELAPGRPRRLDPVEPEVAGVVAREVVAAEVPTLRARDELVGLDLPLRELVFVLLVVVELEHAPGGDGGVDRADDLRVVAA